MELKIRRPNLEHLGEEGVPQDFLDVKDYFNRSLEENTLPWITRKIPITNREIREKWIPSLDRNISFVAELNGKVVCSATVFYDTSSTEYTHSELRKPGELASTTSPSVNYGKVTKEVLREVLNVLKRQNKIAVAHIAIESPANQTLRELGYEGEEIHREHYKSSGLSGKVLEYSLP